MGKLARNLVAVPERSCEPRDGSLCPDCQAPMELHQPDIQAPQRMLGICSRCHAWTLIRVGGDGQLRLTAIAQS